MVKLISNTNTQSFAKIVLEEDSVGTYVFIFETAQSQFPERDYLQNNLTLAQEICLEDYGVPLSSWRPFGA